MKKSADGNRYGHGVPQANFQNPNQANFQTTIPPIMLHFCLWITKFGFFVNSFWNLTLAPILSNTTSRYLNWLLRHTSELLHWLLFMFHPSSEHGLDFANCLYCISRKCLFWALAVGPIPRHIAFIMDGNRRFARRHGLKLSSGYSAGFMSLLAMLDVCHEMGVKNVSVYVLSIDNFKRKTELDDVLFPLLQEKLESLCNSKDLLATAGIKINFIGNLKLLPETIQAMAKELKEATKNNNGLVLFLVLAYTFADEIMHAVQESCREKLNTTDISEKSVITVDDLEKNMYSYEMGLPDPEIVVRSSGCTRLSNFLLWQTTNSLLVTPHELWPEMSAKTIVWTVLEYQRAYDYLKVKKSIIDHTK